MTTTSHPNCRRVQAATQPRTTTTNPDGGQRQLQLTGMVFDIQRFSVHDGPGIRTTVFLKGCPLRCLWCHNPESQERGPEIAYLPAKCISCGRCITACPLSIHVKDTDGRHVFDRRGCTACGACTANCHARALELTGRPMAVGGVIAAMEEDRPFYATSGGGVTVSGGEPLSQPGFTSALLQEAKLRGLHTCVETCGFTAFRHLARIAPHTDLFLYDFKETDDARHLACTGVRNGPIIRNLLNLDRLGARIILRCPIIPGLNDRSEHFAGIAEIANRMTCLRGIEVMPYHALGQSKHGRFGKPSPPTAHQPPDPAAIATWMSRIAELTDVPVRTG